MSRESTTRVGILLDDCGAEQTICHIYCVVARQDYVLDINLGVTPTASFCAESRGSRLQILFPPLPIANYSSPNLIKSKSNNNWYLRSWIRIVVFRADYNQRFCYYSLVNCFEFIGSARRQAPNDTFHPLTPYPYIHACTEKWLIEQG